jgi:hypothetical protein
MSKYNNTVSHAKSLLQWQLKEKTTLIFERNFFLEDVKQMEIIEECQFCVTTKTWARGMFMNGSTFQRKVGE